jgi:GT2 family glycosyltransferase
MAALLAALGEDSGCGVAGGAVLDPSGAIRHAGFAPPREGRLTRRHAGFPAPALYREVMRPVFACSSAFLGVRRAVFEATGGFSHAYRTRDWADADFCLRARAQGHGVVFVPQARVVGYGGDRQARTDESAIADRVDALRFARERTNEMTDWREENPPAERPGAEQPQAAQAIAVIDPRWAA